MRRIALFTIIASLSAYATAGASTITIDLSGATTGTYINGVGGDFTQIFAGQSVAGIGVTGSPTNPLALATAGSITVDAFNPVVSAASNSLLSQTGNAAPLALLLDSLANSLTWTMGFFNGGSVTADLFASNGSLVGSQTFSASSGYGVFTLSGFGNFAGVLFRDNNDASGLRFMNFSYETAAVPEPSTLALAGIALAAMATRRRRRR